jgi:hypothetical protein
LKRVVEAEKGEKIADAEYMVTDPDGHHFYISAGDSKYPLKKVTLNVADLHKTRGTA